MSGGFGTHGAGRGHLGPLPPVPGQPMSLDKILLQLLYEFQQIRRAICGDKDTEAQGIVHYQSRIAVAMEAEVDMLGNSEVAYIDGMAPQGEPTDDDEPEEPTVAVSRGPRTQ